MWEQASDEVRQTYGRSYFDNQLVEPISPGRTLSSEPVLDAVEDALLNVSPQARYLVGGSFSVVDKLGVRFLSACTVT